MTKVQLRYELLKPLEEDLYPQIARLHTVYGILRVVPDALSNKLLVEYDASRLSPLEVEKVLHRAGLPIALSA